MPMSPYMKRMREKIGTDLIMMPAASAIIFNGDGHILLQKRRDNGRWGMLGGAIEPLEEPANAVIREVYEESGLKVNPERIIGVYGGKDHLHTYPNGDQVAIISIVFLCRIVGGKLVPKNNESLDLKYFSVTELPELDPKYEIRIQHAIQNENVTQFRVF